MYVYHSTYFPGAFFHHGNYKTFYSLLNSSSKHRIQLQNNLRVIFTTTFLPILLSPNNMVTFKDSFTIPCINDNNNQIEAVNRSNSKTASLKRSKKQCNHSHVILTTPLLLDIFIPQWCGCFSKCLYNPLCQRRQFPCSVLVFHWYSFICTQNLILVNAINKIHNRRLIQTLYSWRLVFLFSLGEPPKCS